MKLLTLLLAVIESTAVKQLSAANRDEVLAEDKISFVNFYADWCRCVKWATRHFYISDSGHLNLDFLAFGLLKVFETFTDNR